MIKRTASSALSDDNSQKLTKERLNSIEKFAILIFHHDDYILNGGDRLTGDAYSTVKQLETLGYNVISINPKKWQGMAVVSDEEKLRYLQKMLNLSSIDNLRHNASCYD